MHIDPVDTKSAVHVFGEDSQKRQAIEEMGELMAAMNQYRRGRVKEAAVQEEIADVMIMMEQLAHIYGYHGVAYYVEQKMKRLNQRRAEEAWRQHDERFARYKELEKKAKKAKSIGL